MMSLDEALLRIMKALQHLGTAQIDFADCVETNDKPVLILRVITDSFQSIRPSVRDAIVINTLINKDREIYEVFDITCQCFTEREYRLYGLGKYRSN